MVSGLASRDSVLPYPQQGSNARASFSKDIFVFSKETTLSGVG
jgi:hypothetical protein